MSPDEESKYIVFESCLLSLFTQTVGTLLRVTQFCEECEYHRKWESQPFVNNVPAGNLLLSAAILFAGAQPTKILTVLDFLKCATIKPWTFYEHQKSYLHVAISNVWSRLQMQYMEVLRAFDEPLTIGGDGRCDSPGHSAKVWFVQSRVQSFRRVALKHDQPNLYWCAISTKDGDEDIILEKWLSLNMDVYEAENG